VRPNGQMASAVHIATANHPEALDPLGHTRKAKAHMVYFRPATGGQVLSASSTKFGGALAGSVARATPRERNLDTVFCRLWSSMAGAACVQTCDDRLICPAGKVRVGGCCVCPSGSVEVAGVCQCQSPRVAVGNTCACPEHSLENSSGQCECQGGSALEDGQCLCPSGRAFSNGVCRACNGLGTCDDRMHACETGCVPGGFYDLCVCECEVGLACNGMICPGAPPSCSPPP
jgi:hypothetical protein